MSALNRAVNRQYERTVASVADLAARREHCRLAVGHAATQPTSLAVVAATGLLLGVRRRPVWQRGDGRSFLRLGLSLWRAFAMWLAAKRLTD